MRDEFGASVGRDVIRNAMLGEHVKDKQFRQLGRSDRIMSRDEHSLFREPVNDDKDRRISRGARKLFYEIHGDRVPRTLRNRKLLEVAVRPMPGCFGTFARNTGLAEFNDEGPEVGPVVFALNQI